MNGSLWIEWYEHLRMVRDARIQNAPRCDIVPTISYLVEISIGMYDLLSARPLTLFSQVHESSCDKVIVRQWNRSQKWEHTSNGRNGDSLIGYSTLSRGDQRCRNNATNTKKLGVHSYCDGTAGVPKSAPNIPSIITAVFFLVNIKLYINTGATSKKRQITVKFIGHTRIVGPQCGTYV